MRVSPIFEVVRSRLDDDGLWIQKGTAEQYKNQPSLVWVRDQIPVAAFSDNHEKWDELLEYLKRQRTFTLTSDPDPEQFPTEPAEENPNNPDDNADEIPLDEELFDEDAIDDLLDSLEPSLNDLITQIEDEIGINDNPFERDGSEFSGGGSPVELLGSLGTGYIDSGWGGYWRDVRWGRHPQPAKPVTKSDSPLNDYLAETPSTENEKKIRKIIDVMIALYGEKAKILLDAFLRGGGKFEVNDLQDWWTKENYIQWRIQF